MTWFSSGLSNLKEQITSLINDDDDHFKGESHISTESSFQNLIVDSDFSSAAVKSKHLDGSSVPPSSVRCASDYHSQRVLQYSKVLAGVLDDVTILHTSLRDMSDGIETCIREEERSQNDTDDIEQSVTTATIDRLQQDGNAILPNSDDVHETSNAVLLPLSDDYEPHDESTSSKEAIHADEIGGDSNVNNVENDERGDERRSPLLTKLKMQPPQQQQHHRNDDAATEQIENLIIEIDEITEQLNSIEKSWHKTANDSRSTAAVPTQLLIDYTMLSHRRHLLWQKLKVSFLWPTVAKCKNAKISELSVPDSIKEVFLPGFVERTNQFPREMLQLNDDAYSIATSLEKSHGRELASLSAAAKTAPPPSSAYAAGDHSDKLNSCAVVDKEDRVVSVELADETNSIAAATAAAEIDRLRKHLISVEQAYTNELLQCEEEIQILRNELKTKEEQLESIAESYTSINLSTNKTIAQLQFELKQLAEERTQLSTQLCCCRNDLDRAMIDTRNLRSALDFVHKNKDDEICQATENLKHQIRALRSDNERLRETINSLQNDLNDCQLVFNNRNELLNDELKNKNDEIAMLKARVAELLERHGNFEPSTSLSSSSSSLNSIFAAVAETKVQINLIKNIAFRYLTSNSPATKTQSLRILADVLEFSDDEKSRIGMGSGACDKANNNQSLIDEFIRFVENESHPRNLDSRRPTPAHLSAMQIEPSAVGKSFDSPQLPSSSSPPPPMVTIRTTRSTADLAVASLACSSSSILKDALNSNDL